MIYLIKRYFFEASNHDEGFHSKLKAIARERKGFIYNICKLHEIINKRLDKYIAGHSAEKECQRIKENLLSKQKNIKFNLLKFVIVNQIYIKNSLSEKSFLVFILSMSLQRLQ